MIKQIPLDQLYPLPKQKHTQKSGTSITAINIGAVLLTVSDEY